MSESIQLHINCDEAGVGTEGSSQLDHYNKLAIAVSNCLASPSGSSGQHKDNLEVNNVSFDESTDSSNAEYLGNIVKDTFLINELESKYLEEQANLKRSLEDSLSNCSYFKTVIGQKDEYIRLLEKEKGLLENEKQMATRAKESAVKEKENAVIRYVIVEKEVLDLKNNRDVADKKEKKLLKETELLNGKIKLLSCEKTRVCGLLENKCLELKNIQKEYEKLKNDLGNLETKSKWNTVKLKQEMESQLAAEKEIIDLKQQLMSLKANEITKVKDEFDSEKLATTENELMEQQATLILLKHINDDKDNKIFNMEKTIKDLEAQMHDTNKSLQEALQMNGNSSAYCEKQEKDIQDLQTCIDKQVMKLAELQAKVNELESVKTQLSIENKNNMCLKRELEMVKNNFSEQQIEQEKLRSRENELLQINKELSEITAVLQNDCSLYKSKSIAVSFEIDALKKDVLYYIEALADLEHKNKNEKTQRNDERTIMAKIIAEKTKLYETSQKKMEIALGDLEAAKKKHSQTLKESYKEMSVLRRRCEKLEDQKPFVLHKSEISSSAQTSDSESQSSETTSAQAEESATKKLIDRIIRLQHASARQREKNEFLESHSATLLSELQKKCKLLQYYMLRDQSGALVTSISDKNKMELTKYGGVMAVMYGGLKTSSNEMTIELSLEINRKLQAVLEDTLLKNITLKENLDTLGLEVDKLTRGIAACKYHGKQDR